MILGINMTLISSVVERRTLRALIVFILLGAACSCVPLNRMPPQQPPATGSSIGPTSCSAGQEWCEGKCRDIGFFVGNNDNCGRCGNRCSAISESCTGTSCGCAAGYESCMGSCVSSAGFMSDNNNCGRCGNSCSIGESCMGGTCQKFP